MAEQDAGGRAFTPRPRVEVASYLDALPDTVLLVDRAASVVDHVAGAAVPGVGPGVDLAVVLSGADGEALRAAVDRSATANLVQRVTVTLRRTDGLAVYDLSIRALDDERAVVVFRSAEGRLQEERRRGEFLNRVAHDLRTPLTTILLMMDLIRVGGSEQEVAEYWELLRDQVLREQALVERLVAVGRFEAGSQRLEPQPVDVARIVAEVVSAAALTAASGGVRVSREVEDALPRAFADPRALRSALAELVTNALRCTPPGGVIRVVAAQAAPGVVVRVVDTGIGIPAGDLPRVGERYFRASNAPTTSEPAAGVGLASVRLAVEGVGGRLRVASVKGQGTTVEVWLRGE